jgi:hypothetical protein
MVMSIAVEEAVASKRIIWGAPTFDQVRVGWDETRRAAGTVAKFTQQRMTAEFPSGGIIIYRSLDDPDNARGHTADGLVIDEIGDVKDAAWYEVLRPMLLDTGGWAWGIGTPHGRNWFWREHQHSPDRDDSKSWQVPTLGAMIEDGRLLRHPHELENPFISFDEIEHVWSTVPERTFRQEILAEFIEDTGGVFRGILSAATSAPLDRAIDGHRYVIGVDWGKYNDFTVLSVVDAETKEQVYQDRFNRIDYIVQVNRLRALYERFKPSVILAERNSMGDPIIEQLQRDKLPVEPFTTTNASKAEIIDHLALAFERQDVRILNNPTLVGELQAYEMTRLPSGMLRYSAPGGMHDDTVIALALALWATKKKKRRFVKV